MLLMINTITVNSSLPGGRTELLFNCLPSQFLVTNQLLSCVMVEWQRLEVLVSSRGDDAEVKLYGGLASLDGTIVLYVKLPQRRNSGHRKRCEHPSEQVALARCKCVNVSEGNKWPAKIPSNYPADLSRCPSSWIHFLGHFESRYQIMPQFDILPLEYSLFSSAWLQLDADTLELTLTAEQTALTSCF